MEVLMIQGYGDDSNDSDGAEDRLHTLQSMRFISFIFCRIIFVMIPVFHVFAGRSIDLGKSLSVPSEQNNEQYGNGRTMDGSAASDSDTLREAEKYCDLQNGMLGSFNCVF